MERPRVLVIDRIHPHGVDLLRRHAEVEALAEPPTTAELADLLPSFDGLLMRVTPDIRPPALDRRGRLSVIACASVGLDHVDMEYARATGVDVFNLPAINSDSVAEFAIGLLLSLARELPRAFAEMRRGAWNKHTYAGSVELRGKTLGIVGLGQIGSRVARIAGAFGMDVLACDPYVEPARAAAAGVRLLPLAELLPVVDFLSLHVPLTAETRGMIGSRELALMRPGGFLINTARGGVVDEDALRDALRGGRVAGAALDVFAREPGANPDLLGLPNVLGTPHIAGPTREALRRAATAAAVGLLRRLGAVQGQ